MCEVHWKWTDMTDKSGGDGYNPGHEQITHNKSRREEIRYDMNSRNLSSMPILHHLPHDGMWYTASSLGW